MFRLKTPLPGAVCGPQKYVFPESPWADLFKTYPIQKILICEEARSFLVKVPDFFRKYFFEMKKFRFFSSLRKSKKVENFQCFEIFDFFDFFCEGFQWFCFEKKSSRKNIFWKIIVWNIFQSLTTSSIINIFWIGQKYLKAFVPRSFCAAPKIQRISI